MLYDISHPHDLRVTLGKPSISTTEIDQLLDDPAADHQVQRQLLADVEVQGYPDPSSSREQSHP
jgi:hypothetical protein